MVRTTSAKRGTLTLDAKILVDSAERVERLGLVFTTYIAILVRNDLITPTLREVVPTPPGQVVRQDRSLSLPARLRTSARLRAARLGAPFSRYVEALIEHDLAIAPQPLAVLHGTLPSP